MNTFPLPGLDDWSDFDRTASVLTQLFGWREVRRVNGPDARVCSFTKNGFQFWLVFDDVMGMALKCEGDSADLASIGGGLLAALNSGGAQPPA